MCELLALGGVVTLGAMVTRWLSVGELEQKKAYCLTPPAFDRRRPLDGLLRTPLEVYTHPRRRLFAAHYTDERLLDVRLHMAPRTLANDQPSDFSAHIYVPRSSGGPVRPAAEARFHLQHRADPHSFGNVVLRTEAGGAAFVNGALNLTAAIARAREADATALKSAQPIEARGVSAFFNLPVFRVGNSGSAAAAAAASNSSQAAFEHKSSLRSSSTLGVRFDERAADGRSSYSLGAHCDPRDTLAAVRGGHSDTVQLGGWMAQETDQFRLVGESVFTPLRSSLPVTASSTVEGVSPSHPLAASSLVPPRVAASLPALVSSRVGIFWTPSRAGLVRPGYEVGFTLSNDSLGRQELAASYYHHLTVRRNIRNPFEKKENRAINNYVDFGMDVVYRNDEPAAAVRGDAANARAMTPPSLRFGASWQLNKNSLCKFRVQDSSVSILYALKSWWEPSASAAFSLNHSFSDRQTSVGLSLQVENIGDVLFSKPDPEYRRMIANQRENVANLIDLDEDY